MSHTEASRTSSPPVSHARLSRTRFLWWDWGSVRAPGQEDGVTALLGKPGFPGSTSLWETECRPPFVCFYVPPGAVEHGRFYTVSYFKKKEILIPN